MNEFRVDQRRDLGEGLSAGLGPKEVSQKLGIRLYKETHDGPAQFEFHWSSEKNRCDHGPGLCKL